MIRKLVGPRFDSERKPASLLTNSIVYISVYGSAANNGSTPNVNSKYSSQPDENNHSNPEHQCSFFFRVRTLHDSFILFLALAGCTQTRDEKGN